MRLRLKSKRPDRLSNPRRRGPSLSPCPSLSFSRTIITIHYPSSTTDPTRSPRTIFSHTQRSHFCLPQRDTDLHPLRRRSPFLLSYCLTLLTSPDHPSLPRVPCSTSPAARAPSSPPLPPPPAAFLLRPSPLPPTLPIARTRRRRASRSPLSPSEATTTMATAASAGAYLVLRQGHHRRKGREEGRGKGPGRSRRCHMM